ncbi:hypothetical protein [Natronoglycomyces albus]|uniref:NurA domain-containing protein n=1 Tax=Natronoglycomyces albus TaxID=2811108 RepID=A0A895XUZ2_9ACTN|nr:hypothetical protein [Natronoglycomyces albus]QSB06346.1 hypothetical protein JQS30_05400 [Natronoglycomyces albus]
MHLSISQWNPAFTDNADGPTHSGSAVVEADVEMSAHRWRACDAAPGGPRSVALVDGVQRFDAHVELTDEDDNRFAGLCASWAAGAVICDIDAASAHLSVAEVDRALFTGAAQGPQTPYYPLHSVPESELDDLAGAVQKSRDQLERAVSNEVAGRCELLVMDGSLRGRTALDDAVGYIKSHQRSYLGPELSRVVTHLRAGQRTPVFHLTTTWPRYCWYLRLPGSQSEGWAGIARLEAAAELTSEHAVALADRTTQALPRMAASLHKDARAPQNLTPIAGLERQLKRKLGDSRLLLRSLRQAAASATG